MLIRPLTAPLVAQPRCVAGRDGTGGAAARDAELTAAIRTQRTRLWRYVRSRGGTDADAEDVLQDVFGELVEAYRALLPIERLGAWLLRVARNRLIDSWRARARSATATTPPSRSDDPEGTGDSTGADWASLLPDPGTGPEAAYLRSVLLEELAAAIAQLPAAQREAFIAHELDGESFAAMAARTGVGINTLLARKHYAVQYLRRQLAAWRDEFLD
jgi:RNA polymerase sigma factor (sigma-70 family)